MSVNLNKAPCEEAARKQLIDVVKAMLDEKISYFEGAGVVLGLRNQVVDVMEPDCDLNAFALIQSETDHLPYEAQRHLWNSDALAKLESDYKKNELWAAKFAREACENLLKRFGNGSEI